MIKAASTNSHTVASPYLSPPTELQIFKEEPMTQTIDPQILTSLDPPLPPAGNTNFIGNYATALSPDFLSKVKSEAEEDYGFSKFAAERDAARDDMDLDEDSKLLMSEEGKKLSSKERRQLRNKVSARNFRERRKEYITHLESLVSKHQMEATLYKRQVDLLKSEKDDLASELSKLKITISSAVDSNKLLQQSTFSTIRPMSRCDTPSRETSLIPNMTKDINPYSANAKFEDWPLSGMPSPSGSLDFNLHNYTSVFCAGASLPMPSLSEKELLGKSNDNETKDALHDTELRDTALVFDKILCSILGSNWSPISDSA